ncbi:hypothetical protein [Carboxylicivirga marina]|uniref:hypothetical protein n=1 Tax=Carboxylicivirga marina TaxID=2800988 RepID=UPI00259A186A|nr:hypothetical protein [uncultured Carboxylicivirga sp.]
MATEFVGNYIKQIVGNEVLLNNVFVDNAVMQDLYLFYFAMNYIEEGSDKSLKSLQVLALEGMVEYCTNSSNKLKMTKELKEIQKLINEGTIEQSIENSALIISA